MRSAGKRNAGGFRRGSSTRDYCRTSTGCASVAAGVDVVDWSTPVAKVSARRAEACSDSSLVSSAGLDSGTAGREAADDAGAVSRGRETMLKVTRNTTAIGNNAQSTGAKDFHSRCLEDGALR